MRQSPGRGTVLKKSGNTFWIFLGLAIFAVLLWSLDLRQSLHKLSHLHYGWFFLGLGLMALTQYVGYFKWKVMYGATMIDTHQPLLPIFTSVLVTGMLTPARTGDVLASLAWKQMQGKVLAWSIFHRISEGVTTLVLCFLVLGFVFRSYFSHLRWVWMTVFLGGVILGILIVFSPSAGHWFFKNLKRILMKLKHFPFVLQILSFEEKIKNQLELFYETMGQFRKRHVLTLLVIITLGNRCVIIAANMALLRSLGVDLPPVSVLGILAATWMGSFFSPTPNGIGIGDVPPSLLLSRYGFADSAGAYILINRFIDILIIFFWSGLLALYVKGKAKPQTAPA